MKNTKIYYATLLGAALLALAGCHKDPVEIVKQRSAERWNLLINHQPVKAYDYLSPGYRATHTLDQYVAFIGTARLQWKSASAEAPQCENDVCTVKVMVKSVIPGQLISASRDIQHEAPVIEKWVLSEGQWYFLPDANLQPSADTGANQSAAPAPAPAQETPSGK